MKAFIVILCWLLIGFFYWSMSKNCCAVGANKSQSALISKVDTIKESSKSKIDTLKSTSKLASGSSTQTQSGKLADSASRQKNSNAANTAVTDYDHSTYNTITVENGSSHIPLKTEDTFNDEIKAHLEQVCAKMGGNLSKVKIVGFNRDNRLASKTSLSMENFLIRCGISPFRISRTNCKIDTSESHIKMFIID